METSSSFEIEIGDTRERSRMFYLISHAMVPQASFGDRSEQIREGGERSDR